MLPTSSDYKQAINAPTRQIVPRAVIDLSDPDLVVSAVTGDYDADYSFPAQLYDRDGGYSGGVYATLELNRWVLDGSQMIMPPDPASRSGEQGVIGSTLSGTDYANGTRLVESISGVDTLQVVTVASTGVDVDGRPTELTLNVYSYGALLHTETQEISGTQFVFSGFTAIQPTAIEIIVNKWSLPRRRYRFSEFLAGYVETWGGENIHRMSVIRKADFSNLTIPYSSASISIDNTGKRFDPSNKAGLFQSVASRQPVPLWYGVSLGDSYEYVPVGVYYQQNLGWSLENDGLTIRWDLIDIIGLLVERKFELTGAQPTTLLGWIEQIVGQLGPTFTGHYTIDGDLGSTALVCAAEDIANISCGDLLRFVCQASSSYPCSDPETGYLHIKALNNTVQDSITMRMQNTVANSHANTDIAFLSFDIGGTLYNIPGTTEISDMTVNIKNPFIPDQLAAVRAAQMILQQYGGDLLDLAVRGDAAREIGDMISTEVYRDVNVAARIFEQQLTLENGVMTNTPVKCLQANGGTLYTDVMVITESGTYTMPAGVTEITLVLISGGDGGDGGNGGTAYYLSQRDNGTGGLPGLAGKVYSNAITINDGQTFEVNIGAGGEGGAGGNWYYTPPHNNDHIGRPGMPGQPTTCTFSTTFSSANGVRMDVGYADLLTNVIYALNGQPGRTGISDAQMGAPGTPNTGNGGSGGDGGAKSQYKFVKPSDVVPSDVPLNPNQVIQIYKENGFTPFDVEIEEEYPWMAERLVITANPTKGASGGRGGSGVCLIFYAR